MLPQHANRTRRGGRKGNAKASKRSEKIATTIARLDQLPPGNAQVAGTIVLLKQWLRDESGYDEEAWPALKKALDKERQRAGARRLFDG